MIGAHASRGLAYIRRFCSGCTINADSRCTASSYPIIRSALTSNSHLCPQSRNSRSQAKSASVQDTIAFTALTSPWMMGNRNASLAMCEGTFFVLPSKTSLAFRRICWWNGTERWKWNYCVSFGTRKGNRSCWSALNFVQAQWTIPQWRMLDKFGFVQRLAPMICGNKALGKMMKNIRKTANRKIPRPAGLLLCSAKYIAQPFFGVMNFCVFCCTALFAHSVNHQSFTLILIQIQIHYAITTPHPLAQIKW